MEGKDPGNTGPEFCIMGLESGGVIRNRIQWYHCSNCKLMNLSPLMAPRTPICHFCQRYCLLSTAKLWASHRNPIDYPTC